MSMDERLYITSGLVLSCLICILFVIYVALCKGSGERTTTDYLRGNIRDVVYIGFIQIVFQPLILCLACSVHAQSCHAVRQLTVEHEKTKVYEPGTPPPVSALLRLLSTLIAGLVSLNLIAISDKPGYSLIAGIVIIISLVFFVATRDKCNSDKDDGSPIHAVKYGRHVLVAMTIVAWIVSYTRNVTTFVLGSSVMGILQILGLLDCMERDTVIPAITSIALLEVLSHFLARKTVLESTLLVLAGLVALSKSCCVLRISSRNRTQILLLVVLPTACLFALNSFAYGSRHPMEILHQQHVKSFENKLARQSKSLSQAVHEYQRRNHRYPPPGFGIWYTFARQRRFELIDEFDTIMSSIEPLWEIEPHILRSRLESASEAMGTLRIDFFKGAVNITGDHYHGPLIQHWLEPFFQAGAFSRVSFLLNWLDEPRVLPLQLARSDADWNVDPFEDLSLTDLLEEKDVTWQNMAHRQWLESPNTLLTATKAAEPPFITSLDDSRNFSKNPELLVQHGFFQAPETFSVTNLRLPLLSQGAPPNFGDILYPSPYYPVAFQNDVTDGYKEASEPSWNEKFNEIYWSGSSTGQYNEIDTWQNGHRQRLTALAAKTEEQIQGTEDVEIDLLGSSTFASISLGSQLVMYYKNIRLGPIEFWWLTWKPIAKVQQLFYFSMNRFVQCTEEACAAMSRVFDPAKSDDTSFPDEPNDESNDESDTSILLDSKSRAFESKYVIDIDGNGFSGRYYRLLRSKACVLKATIFNEWHDDRLEPWVHYIPVSFGFEELPEMMRFLTEDDLGRGDEMGHEIAEAGRTWAAKALREDDMAVVMAVIAMELERVTSDDRDEMRFIENAF